MTTQELYAKAHEGYYNSNHNKFLQDVELAFEFTDFASTLKAKIHSLAWEQGHSAGYGDVVSQYFDLVALARIAMMP